MITVLADDLSGAAEVGGAALARGIGAEVQIAPRHTAAPALCLDTDTRSHSTAAAAERAAAMARACRERAGPLFKKVDSVLRGPVAAELAGLLAATGLARALIVPANPRRGRVVRAGRYLIDEVPLSETEFALDPEFPARSADVVALLGSAPGLPVTVVAPGAALPPAGLVVGEAECPEDLAHWVSRLDAQTLPAGAAEFFDAWLAAHGPPPAPAAWPAPPPPRRVLVVSGSTSAAASAYCRRCEAEGVPVLRMPPELFDAGGPAPLAEAHWEAAARQALAEHPRVVMAIDRPLHPAPDWPHSLRRSLAGVVSSVLAGGGVDRLYVEGGATARAIVERLGWVRLRVVHIFAPGIVGLQALGAAAPLLVLKPGSYAWEGSLNVQNSAVA